MMFSSEVLLKETQLLDCFKSFAVGMCESVAESLSGTDVEIVCWNMFNKFLHIVTSYPTVDMLELLWTGQDLARVGLSCHYAADYLGVHSAKL